MRTDPSNLIGHISPIETVGEIAFDDHKIKFMCEYARGKKVLDVGCVQHNPEQYRSPYWVHRALKEVATKLVGLDLYEDGVNHLTERGFDIRYGDAQDFDLNDTFDVIVAGDIIEHLEDFHGFFACCKKHLSANGKLLISTPNPWFWHRIGAAAIIKRVPCNSEHTCWFCPTTLRQIASRHGFTVNRVEFGSRSTKERLMPLPTWLKHTSFHAELSVE